MTAEVTRHPSRDGSGDGRSLSSLACTRAGAWNRSWRAATGARARKGPTGDSDEACESCAGTRQPAPCKPHGQPWPREPHGHTEAPTALTMRARVTSGPSSRAGRPCAAPCDRPTAQAPPSHPASRPPLLAPRPRPARGPGPSRPPAPPPRNPRSTARARPSTPTTPPSTRSRSNRPRSRAGPPRSSWGPGGPRISRRLRSPRRSARGQRSRVKDSDGLVCTRMDSDGLGRTRMDSDGLVWELPSQSMRRDSDAQVTAPSSRHGLAQRRRHPLSPTSCNDLTTRQQFDHLGRRDSRQVT